MTLILECLTKCLNANTGHSELWRKGTPRLTIVFPAYAGKTMVLFVRSS